MRTSVCLVLVLGTLVLSGCGLAVDRGPDEGERLAGGGVPFRIASATRPLVLVETRVNGRGPYSFALDTGASMTVLSSELADSLGVKSLLRGEGAGAGGRIDAGIGLVRSLEVGGRRLAPVQVAIVDLRTLSQVAGTELDGIIGHNVLKNYRVTIDYPGRVLRLEPPGRRVAPSP